MATVTVNTPDPGDAAGDKCIEICGVSSGATYIDITVSADGYESVTETVKVFADMPVMGWVYGLEPISGASLTFYNTDGSVICETGPVTTEQGSFFPDIKDLPPDCRVAAYGGTNVACPCRGLITLVPGTLLTLNNSKL